MRFYSMILALCAVGLILIGGAIRNASSSAVASKSTAKTSVVPKRATSKAIVSPNNLALTLLEGCSLTASSNGTSFSSYTASNPLTVDQGYLRLEAPPGSWGFIFCDASVIPPNANNSQASTDYGELLLDFESLAAAPGQDFGSLTGETTLSGPIFYGPNSYFSTVMLLPLTVDDPEYEAEAPNNPYNTVENSIRRFFQPVVAAANGSAVYLPWDADFAGWSSPTVDAPDVGALMQDEWIRMAAGKTDKTLLDFRVMWEWALAKKLFMNNESSDSFYGDIDPSYTTTYAERARALGLRLRCQAVFIRVANPSPITSNPLTIGGLTGIGAGTQVSLGLSSFIEINIQIPNGLDELDAGIDVHSPGFTCYAGETTKMYAYGVTGGSSILTFHKADHTEFDVSCQRAGVGKVKFVIPEEHTGTMYIVRSQNNIGARVYQYAASDMITVLQ